MNADQGLFGLMDVRLRVVGWMTCCVGRRCRYLSRHFVFVFDPTGRSSLQASGTLPVLQASL